MRPLPVEPLAGTPSFVLGLAIIRGLPTPVVDGARLIGGAELEATRFVTLNNGPRPAALAVGEVLGIRTLPAGALAEVPRLLREASADVIASIGALDAELLVLLETAHLVPDAVWSALAAPEEPA